MDIKSFSGLEIKNADLGLVSAVFSTFGVVDRDNDIIEPGAIKGGTPIRVSAYGHASWGGFGAAMLPVGRGVVYADDEKAWAEMEFFMDTTHGADTFRTIKGMGDLQEWSYSLQNVRAEYEEMDGRTVRRIKSLDIHEVSPVLMGASIGTHTTAVKSGLKLSDHLDTVLADVEAVAERAQAVLALRAQKGGGLSETTREQLGRLDEQLVALRSILAPPAPEQAVDDIAKQVQREYLRFIQLTH